MQRITSRQNAVVAEYREAARSADRDVLLLDGSHLVNEALQAGVRLRHVLVASDALHSPEIAGILQRLPHTATVAEASAAVMDAASPVRSASRIVALGHRPLPSHSPFDSSNPLAVIACDVQDPGNVGAMVRVAEAAGASGFLLAGQTADPFSWKALRGSMGSALRVPIVVADSVSHAISEARRCGLQVVATVPRRGTPLFEADLAGPTALLIGGEGLGLETDVIADADLRVTIPMEAAVESLNAATATAVLLYEVRRQRTVLMHAAGRD